MQFSGGKSRPEDAKANDGVQGRNIRTTRNSKHSSFNHVESGVHSEFSEADNPKKGDSYKIRRRKFKTNDSLQQSFISSSPTKSKSLQTDVHISLNKKTNRFIAPASKKNLNIAVEEITRSTRIHKVNTSKNLSSEAFRHVNVLDTGVIGYVRQTRSAVAVLSTSLPSESKFLRKPFISPIDKLLRKNRSYSSIVDKLNTPLSKFVKRKELTMETQMKVGKAASPTEKLIANEVDIETIIPFNVLEGDKLLNDSKENEQIPIHKSEDNVLEEKANEVVPIKSHLLCELDFEGEEVLNNNSINLNTEVDRDDTGTKTIASNHITEQSQEIINSNPELMMDVSDAEIEGEILTTIAAKSPSTISTDSAKGSSLANENSWIKFSTGDLFWGQIYSYCYWPCMVCPDPEGKTITTDKNLLNDDQHVIVHVRFFADNGRRNWVKKENLIAYTGLQSYMERVDRIEQKYGKKSLKYKLFIPKKIKRQTWDEAISEADFILNIPYQDRLERFYEIYENTRSMQKLQRKRRQSMFMPTMIDSTSDVGSIYGSTDNIYSKQTKRYRSTSPFSPAYSPIKGISSKRQKLNDEDDDVYSESITSSNRSTNQNELPDSLEAESVKSVMTTNSIPSQDGDNFNNSEFKKFYTAMKGFVMGLNKDENLENSLVIAVRNIWALKHINLTQMHQKLINGGANDLGSSLVDVGSGEGSIKRLSNRLKNIVIRRSLTLPTADEPKASTSAQARERLETKPKGPINRPIEEVISDIFHLDSKYLFKGMSREPVCKYCYKPGGNIKRCAKGCQSYLHKHCLETVKATAVKKIRRPRRSKLSALVNENTMAENIVQDVEQSISAVAVLRVSEPQNTELADDGEIGDKTDTEPVTCNECLLSETAKCGVCNRYENNEEEIVFCSMSHCGKGYHPSCCRYWPQAKIIKSKNNIESFRCPSHVCHTCVSDDPKGKFQHLSNSKLIKCVKCPASYHMDSTCIPAGSQILTAAHLICPRHSTGKSDSNVNVNWCFICVNGGQVVCCETCPIAVHAACLNIHIEPNEGYICEECESGRLPLYGEMVWAKFNAFRWWPAIILPPTEVPQNIMKKSHNPTDFVVRFFGTHDHGWISRRRVYLYLEGDASGPPKQKSNLDQSYKRGVEEAKTIYAMIKLKKDEQKLSNENKEKLHPQPYIRIKANRAVAPVKLHMDIEKVNKCECKPNSESPCGPDSNCLNRVLYHECNPKLCPAGDRCQNQMFESKISPRLDVVYMKERGFGLVLREPISAGTFIIEYVGEIINDDEFRQRIAQKTNDREENFYFLSVEKDYIIDAGPKGNLARFMNHSCDPNCETQKWSVNGLNRIGLFAIKDISANVELTFNYHWDELLGTEKKTCHCGATKCAGQIGGKYKEARLKDILEGQSKGKHGNALKRKKQIKIKVRAQKTKDLVNKNIVKTANDNEVVESNSLKESDI